MQQNKNREWKTARAKQSRWKMSPAKNETRTEPLIDCTTKLRNENKKLKVWKNVRNGEMACTRDAHTSSDLK